MWKGQGFSSFDPTGNSYFFFELLVLLVRVGKPFSENIGRTWHLLWVFFVPHIETGPQFTLLTVSCQEEQGLPILQMRRMRPMEGPSVSWEVARPQMQDWRLAGPLSHPSSDG